MKSLRKGRKGGAVLKKIDICRFCEKLISFFRKKVRIQYILIGFAIALQVGSAFFMGTRIGATANSKNDALSIPGVLISINGTPIGVLKSEAVWYTILEEIKDDSIWFTTDVVSRDSVSFETAQGREGDKAQPIMQPETFKKSLRAFLNSQIKGVSLVIEGEPVLSLGTRKEAETVLQEIIELYTPQGMEDDEIKDLRQTVSEGWDAVPGIISRVNILTQENAKKFLLKGTLEEKNYAVVRGDTIWSIAKKHNLTVDDVSKANPGLNPEKIYPADIINLIVPKPYIHVRADYTHVFVRQIPYRTEIIRDDDMYRTDYVVERAGVSGRERVTTRETMLNGQLTEQDIVFVANLSQPVACILRQGTKRTPEDVLVGSCMLPEGLGKVSSYFGPRWGTFHAGIDMGVDTGTPIHAYKSGTVTFAGYSPKYGNYVDIDHSNGICTRYGHCSELLVKREESVSGGEIIALSGNTGYSTGPHVHFEIQLDGRPIDPLRYLKDTFK